jgi:hypothetical protein
MSTTLVGVSSGTLVPPGSKLRATFGVSTLGILWPRSTEEELRAGYNDLAASLPTTGVGYVASSENVKPGDKALTVDIRRASSGPGLSAGAMASAIDNSVDWLDLNRLELLKGQESAAEAAAAADSLTAAQTAQPGIFGQLSQGVSDFAKSLGSGFTWVVLVLGLALVALILYFLR